MDRHVARMTEMRNGYKILIEKSETEKKHLEDVQLGCRMILKWIL